MRKPENEKSLPHFKLEEALRQEGCALCRLVENTAHAYLDNLMYELVNDPAVQDEFKSSLGFCNRHAYQALKMREGLGMAILYGVAVREMESLLCRLADDPKPQNPFTGFLKRSSGDDLAIPEPGEGCMVCAAEDKAEERYLKVFLEGAEDGSLDSLLEGPGAVCLRHLSRASALVEGRLPPRLTEIATQALNELGSDLEKYVRHNDYRFSEVPWGKERDSPRRAVKLLLGSRGW